MSFGSGITSGDEFVRNAVPHLRPGLLVDIVRRNDGGPMRRIATGRQRKPVGSYYSLKNGRALAWESRNELHGFYHAEVRSDVVGYLAQPHTWAINADGLKLRFTPDLELHLANGATEIIEIKGVFNAEKDPHYAAKLNLVASLCDHVGWSFRVLEQQALEEEPYFTAIETIQNYRRTAIHIDDVRSVMETLSDRSDVTWGDVKRSFPSQITGLAKACAMVVRRLIEVDLRRGLSDSSPVRLIRGREAANA